MRTLVLSLVLAAVTAGALVASPQAVTFLPLDQVRPGMVGVGRTVFAGEALADFQVTILGVLRNAMGPRRNLILARLEGGPLANTGVIQGMSGSPVYVDGRLVGAVSYSLGSFPKEPLAGITPIEEMTSEINAPAPARRANASGLAITWPATTAQVFAALTRVARRAAEPLGGLTRSAQLMGPAALADLAPALRPIGAAMVFSGFDPEVGRDVRTALAAGTGSAAPPSIDAPQSAPAAHPPALRPGDAVGMSLVRGDLEMGATGTVTHVDGSRVYAFGHPFLNLGPTSVAMTEAHVYTVLPSLDSSMKIASLGKVVGTVNQDRATAVGGVLGPGPKELEVHLALKSKRAPERHFTFYVLHDEALTPLFTYVAVLNSLTSYERQTGAMSLAVTGDVTLDSGEHIAIDDVFSGDSAVTAAAGAIVAPIGTVVANEFRDALPSRLDLDVYTSEDQEGATIERAWLDTTRPRLGGTYSLQIQLRSFRGGARTISMPITMPTQADGPLTLLVSGASTLAALERRELDPGQPTSWDELIHRLNGVRRNNRLYVRLLNSAPGTVVGGDTLPGLPASVQSVLQADTSVKRASVSRTVVGAWEQRMNVAVSGSRQLTLTLRSAE